MDFELKVKLFNIIFGIWENEQRVTYRDFVDHLKKTSTSKDLIYIPKPTFSRLLHEFLQDKGIIKCTKSELQTIIQESIKEAANTGINGRDELINYVKEFLRIRKIYSPSSLELVRIIGNISEDVICRTEVEILILSQKLLVKTLHLWN